MTLTGGAPMLRLVELLEDGKWHNLEEVIREVGKVIPPGRAIRQAEKNRRLAGGPEQRARHVPPERVIETGRRTIVRSTIAVAKYRYFEVDPLGTSGTKLPAHTRIRMKEVPASVVRSRKLAAEGRLVDDNLIDRLIEARDPGALLAQFEERRSMERIALALLDRLKDRELR